MIIAPPRRTMPEEEIVAKSLKGDLNLGYSSAHSVRRWALFAES